MVLILISIRVKFLNYGSVIQSDITSPPLIMLNVLDGSHVQAVVFPSVSHIRACINKEGQRQVTKLRCHASQVPNLLHYNFYKQIHLALKLAHL